MKKFLLGLAVVAITLPAVQAQDEFDDIYYNPKKSSKSSKSDNKSAGVSNYIADFSSVDIDDYNRRGFYYETEIDTIGTSASTAEDFVYTQQIQKYYNPTIVVDNADLLASIIDNSYGNVDIVFNDGAPSFVSLYTGSYAWSASRYNWFCDPAWYWTYAWGPIGITYNWGPTWSWAYTPSWTYYPGWGGRFMFNPGYGFNPYYNPYYWGWDFGYHHHHHHHSPLYANNRPGASRPMNPAGGWASNTRPGGNHNGGAAHRPGYSSGSRAYVKAGAKGNTAAVSGHSYDRTSSSASVGSGRNHATVGHPDRGTVNNGTSGKTATISTSTINTSGRKTSEVNTHSSQSSTVKSTGSNRGSSNRSYNSGSSNRSNNSSNTNTYNSGSYNSGHSNRSSNSGSSSRSYNSGSSSRSYNSGSSHSGGSRSSGGSSSHGGGGGRRR